MMGVIQKLALFEKTIGYEGTPLSVADRLSKIDEWDSMGIFGFVVMLSKEFGKRLDLQKIQQLETVQDVINLMTELECK